MSDYPAALWHAWKRRGRPDWPATLAGVMADPLRARLIWLEAAHGAPIARRDPVQAPVPPLESPRATTRRFVPRDDTRPLGLDQKMRAAGEKPDDD